MKKWFKSHWKKLAGAAAAFLTGVAGGEAIDWQHTVVSLVNAIF